MVQVSRSQILTVIEAIIKTIKNKAMALSNTTTVTYMKDNGKITKWMVKVHTSIKLTQNTI